MSEPHRTFGGETGSKHKCFACGKFSTFTRDVDSRTIERIEGSDYVAHVDPGDVDPPLLPTTYRCGNCGHEVSELPDSD